MRGLPRLCVGGWGYVEVRLPKLCLTRISTENCLVRGLPRLCVGGASNSCVGGLHPGGYVEVRLPKLCPTRISTENLFGEGIAQVVCGRALVGASNSCVGGLHPCAPTLKWGCPFLAAVSYPNLAQKNLFGAQAVCGF